ncbi:outer membrane protein assembly factor BamE [Chelatococcus sp. SYSU_G07232]|uniref:Outer membrane protein assembly factor BamE n=1 Tax=Chelatococcus albus TaxID=3047466 RepID=A0ABT7AC36_9HYPH|nr:outer membrane protein assembly factor BamE [Chelatococcus sp. SYSU_G07232]MDJ1156927.1 outer membrane protein assembly factor BamE [Chelatococcus sp. SYSU_G07232]
MTLQRSASLKRLAAMVVLGSALGVGLSGCQNSGLGETLTRGYVIDERTLAEIKPGMNVEKVLSTLGTPSTVSTVGNKTFYYISQTMRRTVQFLEPKVVDQRVVAVYFDKNFKVERVANYGLQDGVLFDFISRTTPTSGQDQSFVRQMFRGLGAGSFNPFGA